MSFLGPLGSLAKLVVGRGPMVGELVKLDKEAQREAAKGIRFALTIVSSSVALLLLVIVVKILF